MNKREPKDRLVREIKLKEGGSCSVDWSPDGTRLVVGDRKGGVQVFSAEGKKLWRCKEHTDTVYGVSWAPDGRRIASASDDKTIFVYDAISGEIMLQGEAGLRNWGVTWSPDSKCLAWYVQNGSSYIVRIFDAPTGRPLLDCQGPTSIVWKVSWSPCGNRLASGSYDHTIHIWDTGDGTCLHCLKGHKSDVLSICWSPDGQKLASASNDMTARVWDIRTGECLLTCRGHTDIVWSVAWSPKGNILATGSGDNTVRLWDAEKGTELLQIGNQGHIAVSFSPNGTPLASLVGNALNLLDVSDFIKAKKEAVIDTPFQQYIARQAATIGLKPPREVVKKPTWVPHLPEADGDCLGVLRGPIKESYGFPAVAIFPGGKFIAAGHSDGTIRRWDLETGEILWQGNEQHNDCIRDIAVSPDEARIATASDDITVRIWNADTGTCMPTLRGHKSRVFKVRWSPDGKYLASIEQYRKKGLRIWDAFTGQCIHVYGGDSSLVQAMDWSPNGRFIVTGDNNGKISIWDVDSGHNLYRFNIYGSVIWNIRWSPDNRYVLTSFNDGTVLVVNASDGTILFQCKGHADGVPALDWSGDGRLLATGSGYDDKTLRVWHAETGQEVKRFTFAEARCTKLAFSPDSAFIVSSHKLAEKEDVFRVWDTRDLLPKERETVTTARLSLSQKEPIPAQLRFLPSALAHVQRLNIFPPLSLVRDLLDLLADRCQVEFLKTLMTGNRGIQGLRDLHWPIEARIGLVALFLHHLPPSDWKPPENTTPTRVRDALITALSWEPMEPQPPAPPISLLTRAANQIDDRLLSLLSILGPEAVAADPGLPLRLLHRVKNIPALSITQRRLLGVRISTSGISGQSTGRAPGADRGQAGDIEMGSLRNDWASLLPSQMAMPPMVQMYRHLRNELLFRAREMAEPPRIRPAVILLDVSPPTFGPIEKITRLASFTIAQSLRRAGQRVILLTNSDGIKEGQWLLELNHPPDLVETWLQRTLKPVPAGRSLHLAQVLRAGLQDNDGLEPIILVLSHPWFGAEEDIPKIKGLRGLFVQYAGYRATPKLAPLCEKYHSIETTQLSELTSLLAQLMT